MPLRPLGIGEIIDGAISTMRRHWKIQLGLSAAVVTVVSILNAGALYLVYQSPSGLESSNDIASPDAELNAAGLVATLVTSVVGQLAQMVLFGVLAFVASRAVLGENLTSGQAWAAVRPRIWRLVALSLAVMALVYGVFLGPLLLAVALALAGAPDVLAIAVGVVGTLAAIPAAIYLYVRLGVAAPALVLEKLGVAAAFRRSARLVRRSWWRVLGILLLGFVISSVLSGIISAPFAVGAELYNEFGSDRTTPGVLYYVLITIGSSIAGTLTYPFSAGVVALLYIDLRMRREALDLDLVRAVRVPAAPAPAYGPGPP